MCSLSKATLCKCGHNKGLHRIALGSRRPTKSNPMYISCGAGFYPSNRRYNGKCVNCRCNEFEVKK